MSRHCFTEDLDRAALQALLSESHFGAFRWSSTHGLGWSEDLLRRLGHSQHLGSHAIQDPTELIHPDERVAILELLRESREDGRLQVELRLRQRDGHHGWFELRGRWMDDGEEEPTLVGSVRDASRRRALESEIESSRKLLESFLGNCPAAVYIKDANSRHVYGNRVAAEYSGVPLEEFVGKLTTDLFDEETSQRLMEVDRKVLSGQQTVQWNGALRKSADDEDELFVVDTKFPVVDPSSGEVLLGGFAVDLTPQREMERMVARTQRMDALGQLVGGVAHDFNNTLAVLRGNLELLSTGVAACEEQTLLEEMDAAVDRGARLTKQLLAYGRRAPIRLCAVDVPRLLEEMRRLVSRTVPASIELVVTHDRDLWPARADRAQLENVLLNLSLNARDAMPGGGQLTLRAHNRVLDESESLALDPDLAPGRYVQVVVTDDGFGMPPEVVERVFEPFFSTKPFGLGSGMGLPMVFGSMKQLDGAVSVESTEGEGTTVELYFPVADKDLARGPSRRKEPLIGGVERLLLVEDDTGVRRTLSKQLGALGYGVLEASNAQDALRILQSDRAVRLVVTDDDLPGKLQGRDLAQELCQSRPELPVVLLSGYERPTRDTGATELTKPVRLATLARTVRARIDAGPPRPGDSPHAVAS